MFRKEYLNQTSTHQHLWLLPKSWLLWKISALAFDFKQVYLWILWFWKASSFSIALGAFIERAFENATILSLIPVMSSVMISQHISCFDNLSTQTTGIPALWLASMWFIILIIPPSFPQTMQILAFPRIGVWYLDYLNFLASSTQEVNICFGSFQVDEIFERCLFSFCFFWKSSFLSLLGKDFLVRVMQRAVWQDFRMFWFFSMQLLKKHTMNPEITLFINFKLKKFCLQFPKSAT